MPGRGHTLARTAKSGQSPQGSPLRHTSCPEASAAAASQPAPSPSPPSAAAAPATRWPPAPTSPLAASAHPIPARATLIGQRREGGLGQRRDERATEPSPRGGTKMAAAEQRLAWWVRCAPRRPPSRGGAPQERRRAGGSPRAPTGTTAAARMRQGGSGAGRAGVSVPAPARGRGPRAGRRHFVPFVLRRGGEGAGSLVRGAGFGFTQKITTEK